MQEWNTWQIEGRSSSNPYGVRIVVRQLNRWHNVNIGCLGSGDSNRYPYEARFDWQQIAASALHWARTGEDLSRMPPGWRMSDRDLRVVWYNTEDPERSVIGLWPDRQDPNLPQPHAVMESVEDFFHYTIHPAGATTERVDQYHFSIRAGVNQRHSISRKFAFTRAELPKLFDPGPTNMFGRSADGTEHRTTSWKSNWEIRIEPGMARTSVLESTKLFSAWKKLYLAGEQSKPPLKRIFSLDDN
jgi:hypothetical protein